MTLEYYILLLETTLEQLNERDLLSLDTIEKVTSDVLKRMRIKEDDDFGIFWIE